MPNIDIVKVVIVVVLVALIVGLMIALAALDVDEGRGRDAWEQLNEPGTTAAGNTFWGYLSVGTELLPAIGLPVSEIIGKGAIAGGIAVGIALLIKAVRWVIG